MRISCIRPMGRTGFLQATVASCCGPDVLLLIMAEPIHLIRGDGGIQQREEAPTRIVRSGITRQPGSREVELGQEKAPG
jgi:hypothetical protein